MINLFYILFEYLWSNWDEILYGIPKLILYLS